MDLYQNVDLALKSETLPIGIPKYLQSIYEAQTSFQSKIHAITEFDKERVLKDIELDSQQDLDKALKTAISLLKTLITDYNKIYKVQFDTFTIEDDEFLVRLKKLINQFLIYKAQRLYNTGYQELAARIKNNQMLYLHQTRYDGWREDMKKWDDIERNWYENLSKQNDDRTIKPEDETFFFPNDSYQTHIPTEGILNKNDKSNQENLNLYDAMITMGQYELALQLALDQLHFFISSSGKEGYNPLIVANASYVKMWTDKIMLLPDDFPLQASDKICDDINHLFSMMGQYDFFPQNARLKLTNLIFKYI